MGKTDTFMLSLWDLVTPRWSRLVHRLAGYHNDDDGEPPRGRLKTMPWGPAGIKPLARLLGGDSAFHVEAERRRASGCRTDAGASNPRGVWWGAVANAVPDGSPRGCNASRRPCSIVERVLRHVTAGQEARRAENASIELPRPILKGSPREHFSPPIKSPLERRNSRFRGDYGGDESRDCDKTE